MDESWLLREVETRFAVTGASTPGWADPHADREPLDEEYSRVTDPRKWRIEGARALAWTAALTGSGLAERRALAPGDARAGRDGWRLVPGAPGALPLLVLGTPVDGLLVDLELRVGDPPVGVLDVDCRCDACDSGSADLLETLDSAWSNVVTGQFVHLEAPGRVLTGGAEGWSASGSAAATRAERLAEHEAAARDLDAVRRGHAPDPRWRRVVHGAPWS